MITADQIVCHLVGDYLLQSDWMAAEKTRKNQAALAHAVMYTLPFIFVTSSVLALLFIMGTHFVIDRWRLARYVCWFKNFLAPRTTLDESVPVINAQTGKTEGPVPHLWWHPWKDCAGTGYYSDKPLWMAVWLMIIADNTLHLICNGIAIKYLGA